MTATANQAVLNVDPEERYKRDREFMSCLQAYSDMRQKIILYAPHPGFSVNFKTREMVPLPYPKNILDMLAKVKEWEGEFIKHNFPEFYNPETYESKK